MSAYNPPKGILRKPMRKQITKKFKLYDVRKEKHANSFGN